MKDNVDIPHQNRILSPSWWYPRGRDLALRLSKLTHIWQCPRRRNCPRIPDSSEPSREVDLMMIWTNELTNQGALTDQSAYMTRQQLTSILDWQRRRLHRLLLLLRFLLWRLLLTVLIHPPYHLHGSHFPFHIHHLIVEILGVEFETFQ